MIACAVWAQLQVSRAITDRPVNQHRRFRIVILFQPGARPKADRRVELAETRISSPFEGGFA